MRWLFALAISVCVAGTAPAWASSGGAKAPAHGEAAGEGKRVLGQPGAPSIDMPILVAPVTVDGELHRYVYLSIALKLTDVSKRSMMLERVPYLQDAFLREVHGPSIAHDNDPSIVDEVALKSRLMRVGESIVGAGVIKEIEFRKTPNSPG